MSQYLSRLFFYPANVSLSIWLLCLMFNLAEVCTKPCCGAIWPYTYSEQSKPSRWMKVAVDDAAVFHFPSSLPLQQMQYLEVGPCQDDLPFPRHSLLNQIRNLASKRSAHLSVWGRVLLIFRQKISVFVHILLQSWQALFSLMSTSGPIT